MLISNLTHERKEKIMNLRRFARLFLTGFIALAAVMTPQSVSASQIVDPSTLNPPIPPVFNPE
jgi:uncharacterized membrane protein